MARNLELKARDPDPAASRRACAGLGATVAGELRQRDTYFRVRAGRLKLREAEGRPAELIAYARADRPEARLSEYTVVPVPDPAALHGVLAGTLGVLAIADAALEPRGYLDLVLAEGPCQPG